MMIKDAPRKGRFFIASDVATKCLFLSAARSLLVFGNIVHERCMELTC